MEGALGLNPSAMIIEPLYQGELTDALNNFWIPNTQKFAERYTWYTNWEIVLQESITSIGGIGFGGYPDGEGKTITGYYIDKQQWGQGYATEALGALVAWAACCPDLKTIIGETFPDHPASIRVLEKNGFQWVEINERIVRYSLCVR